MAKTRSEPRRDPDAADHRWRGLTWDDLAAWAGERSVSRGQAYQRQRRVTELALSEDQRLLATVTGTERYCVSVWLRGTRKGKGALLESNCTCPVGASGCKHAVAAVAEYIDRLGRVEAVARADADDPRWAALDGGDRDADDAWEEPPDAAAEPAGRASKDARHNDDDEKIRQFIRAKSRADLAEMVCAWVERFPELKEEVRDRVAAGEGDAERLIARARRELRRVTAREAWRDNWTGAGTTPDYRSLRRRLERLTGLGHADAVVRLGRELLERGMRQVGRSDDEGDTAAALGRCLPVIFDAVAKSGLTPVRKLLFAIDARLHDDYDIIGDAADTILNAHHRPADWSAVADDLSRRLSAAASTEGSDAHADGFLRDYHRNQLGDWLARALTQGGRGDEAPAVYEQEARTTGSYERLVRLLIEQGRDDDAKRWAKEGIDKTAGKWPGIASSLAGQLCELAERRGEWGVVAAHAAHELFRAPSRDRFDALMAAAAKAACQEKVHAIARRFLETGVAPIRPGKGKRAVHTDRDWPLPTPDYLTPMLRAAAARQPASAGPHSDVLIDLAIVQNLPDEALHWYDRWLARPQASATAVWSDAAAFADRVAVAVADTHPERALAVYRERVDRHVTQASVRAYETVASCLRKMKPILAALGRENEWAESIRRMRERYRNRPRFMDILDRLEDRPIVTTRARRS